MSDLCTDIGFNSINKWGEQLCGDHVEVAEQDQDSVVMVLADGLGSGVKANILATLTSKIISTMMAKNMGIEECVATIVATLPVCNVRHIAYSTFTILQVINSERAEIIQYDNPKVVLLRHGKSVPYAQTRMEIDGKTVYKSSLALEKEDTFITMSDGVVHAGVGKTLNYGWQWDNIVQYMEMMYNDEFTAQTMATILLEQCEKLYDGAPGDDATACVVRIRERRPVNLMIGPPANPAEDERVLAQFFQTTGKHIVCGGTTSKLAAQYLHEPITAALEYLDPEIPPTADIQGVDLVTEGVITINRVLTYAQGYAGENSCFSEWNYKKDGASQLARLLFEEATDIHFFVGCAVNPAHQNPDLPINFSIKMRLVDRLAECLKRMGKRIKVSYF